MSVVTTIRGVPVEFPFQPYDIQVDYMDKVIECLEGETTAVLESPTGTGKTLSLLCSSLAWLQQKKSRLQAQRKVAEDNSDSSSNLQASGSSQFLRGLSDINKKAEIKAAGRELLGLPTIIYASRTHSQLSQAVQELKRTAYNHMHCSVLGSRDQLCIHPEVLNETDASIRLQMCHLKVDTRACHFNNRVDIRKEDPEVCNTPILDIEDMMKMGKKLTFCPYYMTKERKQHADIIFTPYNYLLDPLCRKSLGLSLTNSVVILDEGHNVEKVCEDSASIEIRSTDVALSIEETANIMKMISETPGMFSDPEHGDLDPEKLASLKLMLHEFEKVLNNVPLQAARDEITNFPGDYIYDLLEKSMITSSNFPAIASLVEKMIQFLTAQGNGPFARKGKGLLHFADFLSIVFVPFGSKEMIKHSYKVHIREELIKGLEDKRANAWFDKSSTNGKTQRVLSFWCFNPGFGMNAIAAQGIKSLIITSGTLAPLKPLISELGLDVKVRLENPHIVSEKQICVKIVPKGPDGETLNSSYQNRDNPTYISSLGRTIVNMTRIIPQGLLVFFPSYPIMYKCKAAWEQEGIWATISAHKTIFVEPKQKEAFNAAMNGYYEKIRDPTLKGAMFMAVCRGKVSEGLDFADAYGRAVVITGLPYPPLKDPRVILKRKYLDVCHSQDKEYLNGQSWYSLEASRAVNQAIGRVIRHKNDFGAILLLDERFNNALIKQQMSKWLQRHIKVINRYGEVIRDLSQFFKNAQVEFPGSSMKPTQAPKAEFDISKRYTGSNFNFSSTESGSSSASQAQNATTSYSFISENLLNNYTGIQSTDNPNGLVTIHKREGKGKLVNNSKRRKICLVSRPDNENFDSKMSMADYVKMVLLSIFIYWLLFC
ncbi:regulator of telomere elongation helicase 1 homolog isoform X2 [Euwallacea similis]|uniref:regulator of telomere elongation helicase 1 homolog isoform X2 n=1 Tax=Euwallacea similis TaxID=1736056 RepID=UPI00344E11D7